MDNKEYYKANYSETKMTPQDRLKEITRIVRGSFDEDSTFNTANETNEAMVELYGCMGNIMRIALQNKQDKQDIKNYKIEQEVCLAKIEELEMVIFNLRAQLAGGARIMALQKENEGLRNENNAKEKQIQNLQKEIIMAPQALRHYEQHYGRSAKMEDVQQSSVGIVGWYNDTPEQPKKNKQKNKRTSSGMTGYRLFGLREKNTINSEMIRENQQKNLRGERLTNYVCVQGRLWTSMTPEQKKKYTDEAKMINQQKNEQEQQ